MIIGLSGRARSGKDSVAKCLVEDHGFTKLAFADPMRWALYRLDPMIELSGVARVGLASAVDYFGWETLKEDSKDVRRLLQRMGTEVGREMFGQNFWVDYLMDKAKHSDKVVISDCRFLNEIDAVTSAGGQVWRIEREGLEAVNEHISETELDNYQFATKIYNNGTLEDLRHSVNTILGD